MADFTWNEQAQRYRSVETGRFISSSHVRAEIDAFLDKVEVRTQGATQLLVDGRVSLPDWQAQMAQELKDIHIANAVIARGGWEQMTPTDWGRVGHILRDEYRELQTMAVKLERGEISLERAMRGSEWLTRAARGTYEEVHRYAARDAGLVYERSILEPGANHCNDCEDAAAMGWQPVGLIQSIGDRVCGNNCRCELQQSAEREAA